jgi:hypothetical protein
MKAARQKNSNKRIKPRRHSPLKIGLRLRGFFILVKGRSGFFVIKVKRICLIDGQGGGIGKTLIKAIKSYYGESIFLVSRKPSKEKLFT